MGKMEEPVEDRFDVICVKASLKDLKRIMVRDGICRKSADGLKKMAVAISNLFYVLFCPMIAPVPNFFKIA